MSDGHQGTPDGVGRHGLGPHVVGQRVVVRRLVRGERGPSGGPALTDLLGTCLAFGDGVIVVRPDRPDDAEPLRIRLADVVSGKPVPPRAPVRHRVDPREAQVRAGALFADLRTTPLDVEPVETPSDVEPVETPPDVEPVETPTTAHGWLLRDSAIHRARRANSVLAFGPSGLEPDDADVSAVLAHYDQPVASVLAGSPQEARLRALGWAEESDTEGDSLFCLASVSRAARAARGTGTVASPPAVTLLVDGDHATARIGADASGVAAVSSHGAETWLGLRAIEVAPAARRQGLAREVMAELLDWGAERGATTAYLQVLETNRGARALYDALGFTTHHAYRYLTPR